MMRTNEGMVCANCLCYILCIPHCDSGDGEWGACGMWKKITQWDDTCDEWIEGYYTIEEEKRLADAELVLTDDDDEC